MPGILPMKVIKVGTNAQSRIAQACDRCRSKKIRCDGVRPCCTQCANVGFECKTSDKLSRRAFPRGYTESLEERVRSLECEVRELKDLLDEKDEKIDMLTRIHSKSPQPRPLPSPRQPSPTSLEAGDATRKPETSEKDEVFKVQQSPYLLAGDGDHADSYFAGTSSSRTFIEAFKHKVQESGRSTADVSTDLLLTSRLTKGADASPTPASPVVWKAPPRLVSDQLVNIFFQEWAPLFPVLHRPTFLDLYEKYVADPEAVTDKTAVAQLNLVFGIATLSSGTRTSVDLESFEVQLRAAIDAILSENTMGTLQALILAQIFCVQQGDYTRLLSYKGLSMTLSARLGLHQSQKRFALGTLTCETRKKVFWTLYTVDSFTAVTLGLPKQLKDDDVNCEYPVDADDEYVTERGFKPTLPGESTKLSSALALFRAARILSKILEDVFPAKTSYELSMKKLGELSDELDAWRKSLAPHLRLEFAQDKPSTGTISSRSPLLSLTYHYIRALIQRPAVCASLGSRSSSSTMTLASSCKSVVQIVQLLEERGMCFAFCLNKDELLVLSGFGLLFQGLELDSASRILKDNQKTITRIIGVLDSSDAPCAPEFRRVARSFLPSPPSPSATQPRVLAPPSRTIAASPTPKLKAPTLPRHSSDSAAILVNPIPSLPASTRKQLKAIASRFSISGGVRPPKFDVPIDQRRATIHNISLHAHGEPSRSQPSLAPPTAHSPATTSRSEPARSPSYPHHRASSVLVRPSAPPQQPSQQQQQPKAKPKPAKQNLANLDYLSFGPETNLASTPQVPWTVKKEPQPTDWEKLLGSLDNGPTNIYDACYGGRPVEALDITPLDHQPSLPSNAINPADDSAVWTDAATADLWALCQTETNTSEASAFTESNSNGHPDSIFSFASSEGRKSSDDFTTADWGSASSASEGDVYKGICMPADLGQEVDVQFGSAWDGGLSL
ncbi:DNA-binding transcription factor cat8 [Friedmanniomyces endolithicus]|uniref:DNA-binding transcription factor cat8 n=1 Tax=Friedmanniomyces endolithicus TaxID=329885 RepID=A0AAN6FVK1_9PEZI|nr:DNA-binding transcription factor cat8 [Friedmanniomyces endolithicus]KAK0291185.1 DNA-binding transcription factor cat8 [Friedmanniomyces endolithicus]KAK0325287.1 DNA-binding transcription factor cat8 [Friedmanniomyces endolithicus]KAK0996933.1 DNA-binding transcription factor cat8 [Friedmanniomyces endolithicus]